MGCRTADNLSSLFKSPKIPSPRQIKIIPQKERFLWKIEVPADYNSIGPADINSIGPADINSIGPADINLYPPTDINLYRPTDTGSESEQDTTNRSGNTSQSSPEKETIIYLLGTPQIDSLFLGSENLSQVEFSVMEYFSKSHEVFTDLNFEDLNKSDELTQKIKETLVLGPQGYYLPITGFLNIQENKILQEIIQWKLGKDYTREQYFSTIVFPPWYWTFLLNTYNHRFFGYEPNDSPDMVLFYLAQAKGKHITSIWNTEKQAESLSFGTFEEQLSVLKAAMQLYKHESAGNTLKLLEEAYLSNDTPSIKEILQTIQTDRADFYTTTGSRHYIDAAFTERVDLWTQTIMNLVQEKNKTFFIFTDLSLILQEDGIIDRLVDAGFVLTSR